MAALNRTGVCTLLIFMTAAAVGCSAPIPPGSASLPQGIEETKVPGVELDGYVFVSSDPPLSLPTQLLRSGEGGPAAPAPGAPRIALRRATMVMGAPLEEYGGTLELVSEPDAQAAWRLLQARTKVADAWTEYSPPRISLVRGKGPWADAVRRDLDSGRLVSLRDHDPQAWNLVTNLPKAPPSPPIAAGMLKLDRGLLDLLGRKVGVRLDELGQALGIVRVDRLAFGVYADAIDPEYLAQSGVDILVVGKSSYPGVFVSFLLGVAGGQAGMETIDLGNTNAKHRTIEGLHLILKNKGSVLYAAVAGTRERAENLMLSTLSG